MTKKPKPIKATKGWAYVEPSGEIYKVELGSRPVWMVRLERVLITPINVTPKKGKR